MPGKKKKGTSAEDDGEAEQEDKQSRLRQVEEERQEKWAETWERRLVEDDLAEECKSCCAPDRFSRKPRTQTNVWVQAAHDKNTQRVQLTIRDVPVPKPRAPVLPKLTMSEFERQNAPSACDEPMDKDGSDGKPKKKKKNKK